MAAILGDRNHPLKRIQQANIIVLSAERLPVQEVALCAGVIRPAVWRWQVRYADQGVDGLLRDKTHKSGRARLPIATTAEEAVSGASGRIGSVSQPSGGPRWPKRTSAASSPVCSRPYGQGIEGPDRDSVP